MTILLEKPEKISTDHYLLKYKSGSIKPEAGQFVNIKTTAGTDPLLRRPFSIFDYEDDTSHLVIRVAGRGTRILSQMDEGEIDIIGPLGKGFTLVENKTVLLAGGGVGNAPLYYLMKQLRERDNRIIYIYGARSEKYIYLKEKFEKPADKFILATDDGSAGLQALVPEILDSMLSDEKIHMIYTCGPEIMMKKIAAFCGDTPVEVSLENYFGCGIGICSGCTVQTDNGQKRACIDGPVFDGKSINWESIPQ